MARSKAPAVIELDESDVYLLEPPGASVVRALLAAISGKASVGTCRVCTEADCRGCIRRTKKPCWWVDAEQTLCSACMESLQRRTPLEARLIGMLSRVVAQDDLARTEGVNDRRALSQLTQAKKLLAALGVKL